MVRRCLCAWQQQSGAASGEVRRAGGRDDLAGGHGHSIACEGALGRRTACHVGSNNNEWRWWSALLSRQISRRSISPSRFGSPRPDPTRHMTATSVYHPPPLHRRRRYTTHLVFQTNITYDTKEFVSFSPVHGLALVIITVYILACLTMSSSRSCNRSVSYIF